MIYLKFENELGSLNLGGGSDSVWRITDIQGLGLVTKNFNTVSYPRQAGQVITDVSENCRTITVGGDMTYDEGKSREISRVIRILDRPGTLIILKDGKRRSIRAVCSTFEQGERKGIYQKYVIQFMCEYPYFEDFRPRKCEVFKAEDKLISDFSFPLVFTKRTSRVNIKNEGDAKCEPIFYVYSMADSSGTEKGLKILNNTTSQSITLAYALKKDEVVTIDVEKRKIYNDSGESLIQYITGDTYLNDFWLDTGKNEIEVLNIDPSNNITALCEYSNKYVEAIY